MTSKSKPVPATQISATNAAQNIPDIFTLDEQKLQAADSSEKQELYLFQWLAQVERECKTVDIDVLKRSQSLLEKQLLKLISLTSAKPRRPIRFLIGRCFVSLYTRGETRQLFDTVTALHSLIGGNKNITKETRIAAISTTGMIMWAAGTKILTLFAETATMFLKVIKNHNHPLMLRLEAVNAFSLLLKGAGKGATESILKDLMKQLKQGLTDKALVMRVASAQCIQAVIQFAHQPLTAHDVETLLQLAFKAFEDSTFAVRRAVSSLCATLLAFTQKTAITDPQKPHIKYAMTGDDNPTDTPEAKATPLLSIEDMLNQLSTCYNRPNVSRDTQVGVVEAYATLFVLLGTEFVELHYAKIAKHLIHEFLHPVKNVLNASDAAFTRSKVIFLLHNTIGKRLLSEQGQATAIRLLVTDWIKTWPPLMPNQPQPNKHALICATHLVSALVSELEGAARAVQDVLIDPLFVLLTHPSFSVQMAAVWCIRCICLAAPANLPYLLPRSLNALEKNLGNLGNPNTTTNTLRCTIAYAYAAAAIMSVFPARPIYTSFDLSARAMSIATQLIKHTSKDAKIASVQVQVAWVLVGSLMGLGPNLVKLHVSQLLLLWKTALPKPTGKEANAMRTEAEWSFLFHTREGAISSIYSFIAHNSHSLVTLDIAKRIAALLNNTLAFLATTPTSFAASTLSPSSCYKVKVTDQNYALRKRIFLCFVALRPHLSTYESSLTSLLRHALTVFTEPEKIIPSSGAHSQVTASIPGQFVSVWHTADGHGCGVTSKMQGYSIDIATTVDDRDDENNYGKEWVTRDRFQKVEELLERPMIGSIELDPLYIYTTFAVEKTKQWIPQPVAPSTGYIDASIELFATLFPGQPPPVQESTFEQIAKVVKDQRLEKNSPKRAAVLVNVIVALLGALKHMMSAHKKKPLPETVMVTGRATQLMQEILMEAIVHPDPYLRNAASETMGRLTAIVGGAFVSSQMQQLVDLVVSNRDPDVRAGCALAIGYIYSHVGGMAAAAHLKTIVGILLSLSSDPHPVVHAWALEAMTMTVSAAGLMFSSYVNSTLGMVAKFYLSETHEPGSGSVAVSNAGMSVGFTAYQEFGRIIYELIGTLGPELQASSKIRELCLNMVEELRLEPDERVNVEAIRCIQHFLMFAPKHLDLNELVPYLQAQISSLHIPLKKAAVTCLYQLVQRDAGLVFKAAQPGLDNELFKMLDTDPGLSDVKNVIRGWLRETAVSEPSVWVNITKRITTGSHGRPGRSDPGTPLSPTMRRSGEGLSHDNDDEEEDGDDYGDDDADGFVDEVHVDNITSVADASGIGSSLSVNVEIPPRWRTQLFALECLQTTIELIAQSGIREHFDLVAARAKRQQAGIGDYLVFRVPDLIRLSFTTATAPVNELRLAGIALLKMVIEKFTNTADADLDDMLLLEQYAAQIGAALTPAFGADSSSEIVSAAVRVCAIYVGSGIVKDLYQLGRVLKLLTSALDKCKDESKLTGVGEVKDLSPHASVMVRLSVLNAWAELQVASQRQDYLKQVLQPNLASLSPLWLRSLQNYARIRLESDIVALSHSAEGIQASSSGGIDSMYSAATKEVVLPFYRRSWLKIMEAVATLLEVKAPSIMEALEQNPDFESVDGQVPNLFYILFGLCIESLSHISSASSGKTDATTMVICLNALKTCLQPSFTGNRFLPKAVFLELMNVFDRLIQTEGYAVQLLIIEIIQRLIQNYGAKDLCQDLGDESLFDVDRAFEPEALPSTAILYYLLRLLINVFLQNIPTLSNKPMSARPRVALGQENIISLLGSSLETLAMLVGITPAIHKVDMLAICYHIFAEILMDAKSETLLAPRVLVLLKTMFAQFETDLSSKDSVALSRVTNAMLHTLVDGLFYPTGHLAMGVRKNRLLASVLIVTGCPEATMRSASSGILIEALKSALDSEEEQMVLTAHQCLRTFILLPEKKADSAASVALGRLVIQALVPQVISHTLSYKYMEQQEDDEKSLRLSMLDEDIKSLMMLPNGVSDDQKTKILSILLPTLTTLLDDPPYNDQPQSAIHETVMPHVLTLATHLPQTFRGMVGQLPGELRTKLEASVRHSIVFSQQQQQQRQQEQQRKAAHAATSKQPTISLKMDFSNFS